MTIWSIIRISGFFSDCLGDLCVSLAIENGGGRVYNNTTDPRSVYITAVTRQLLTERRDNVSVVIVGGNECMIRQYKNLCSEYRCKVKVYPEMKSGLRNIGSPDLLVLFTNTVSHKMVRFALGEVRGQNTKIARSHSSSMAALKNILEEYTV